MTLPLWGLHQWQPTVPSSFCHSACQTIDPYPVPVLPPESQSCFHLSFFQHLLPAQSQASLGGWGQRQDNSRLAKFAICCLPSAPRRENSRRSHLPCTSTWRHEHVWTSPVLSPVSLTQRLPSSSQHLRLSHTGSLPGSAPNTAFP